MSRLVTSGCSHAYGLGLDDCPTIHHPPSKLGFSSSLSKMLNIDEVNKSDTGASVKQVTATILETTFYKDDIVVINWSHPSRRGIRNRTHWEQLSSWNDDKEWKEFYAKYHHDTDDTLEFFMNINLANYFLSNKPETIINSVHDYYSVFNNIPSWNNVTMDIMFKDLNYYHGLLQCGHADQKSHDIFAERLYKLINE